MNVLFLSTYRINQLKIIVFEFSLKNKRYGALSRPVHDYCHACAKGYCSIISRTKGSVIIPPSKMPLRYGTLSTYIFAIVAMTLIFIEIEF